MAANMEAELNVGRESAETPEVEDYPLTDYRHCLTLLTELHILFSEE